MGRGTKVCINDPGHMTKMATTSIYVKTLKNPFSRTRCPRILQLAKQLRELLLYNVCINDDPGMTMTYLTARSNLVTYAFDWGELLHI